MYHDQCLVDYQGFDASGELEIRTSDEYMDLVKRYDIYVYTLSYVCMLLYCISVVY